MMNDLALLQILLGEFRDKINSLKDIVIREAKFPDAPNKIKVAIGMRRVGKTYFLYQHILNLLEKGVDLTAILYLNFEDDRLAPVTAEKLASLVETFYTFYPENHDKRCYLFLDEIQCVDQWATVIRRLHDTKNAEIFLTGSSAKLLSKEIASSLRGRSLSVEIWPYSFSEYLKAKHESFDSDLYDKRTRDRLIRSFLSYLSDGGFPETVDYPADVKQQTLQEYLDVLIYRDVIERHQVKHPSIVKHLILSMIHSVGKPFAVNKFYNELKTRGFSLSKDILYDYVDHIEDAYLIFPTGIYERSIRKAQTRPKKMYAIDPGMVRALTLDHEGDLGRLFENVVFLDLKRLGYDVSYYVTSEGYEVDFLARGPRGVQKLVQVVWEMTESSTQERETRALKAGMAELKVEGQLITLESYLAAI